ncbi:MAG: hypothetical protein HC927_01250 [Deltaproteobacteria bacterium]|nr:hypothetical protein [Deltaproteobacteria bacterium]
MGQALGNIISGSQETSKRQRLEAMRREALETGNFDKLMAEDPGQALAIQRGELDLQQQSQAMEAKQQEAQRRREMVAKQAMLQATDRLRQVAQDAPEAYDMAYRAEAGKLEPMLKQSGLEFTPTAPEHLDPFARQLRGDLSATMDSGKYTKEERLAAASLAAAAKDPTLRNPEFAAQHPQWADELKKFAIDEPRARAPKSEHNITTNVDGPRMPLPAPSRTRWRRM